MSATDVAEGGPHLLSSVVADIFRQLVGENLICPAHLTLSLLRWRKISAIPVLRPGWSHDLTCWLPGWRTFSAIPCPRRGGSHDHSGLSTGMAEIFRHIASVNAHTAFTYLFILCAHCSFLSFFLRASPVTAVVISNVVNRQHSTLLQSLPIVPSLIPCSAVIGLSW
jgi:hypothetical protein